ncbi:hypothetical protein OSSY52_05240 [Tepiditoga spiralis]|uniref:Uncharacterized protein n=1 Tax=Tepiditoga spiralis TaxID=2108365 RepID=A0A7G1G6E1_9BACT|nr:hypothetical protein [Tepiditoga spiralis]BBE30383.1 hypothetical protein OSSY52_05240 [Tepiditoga spiralis]
MKIKLLIIVFLFFIYIFLNTFNFKPKEKEYTIKDFDLKNGVLNYQETKLLLSNILNTNVLIKNIDIKRENFSLLNIEKEYNIKIQKFYPGFNYTKIKNENYTKLNTKLNTKFLNVIKINFNTIWKLKDTFKRFDASFSGYIKTQNKKEAYIYFNKEIIKVYKGDKLGNRKIIEIFEDGILLLTIDNSFEVIL